VALGQRGDGGDEERPRRFGHGDVRRAGPEQGRKGRLGAQKRRE
jgi:hypothetical protein